MPCETCKQSSLDSYEVVRDTILQLEPNLSDHDVRLRAASQFRPIFREMKQASIVENSGEKQYQNGEFLITDEGKIQYEYNGYTTTAEQLHENQLKSSLRHNDSSKFSLTDYQTTLLVQQSFQRGASVVRTSYAREGSDNRDIIEFRYDRVTRKGGIFVINASENGVSHTFDGIKNIAKDQAPHLHEASPSDQVFVLTDIPLDTKVAYLTISSAEQRVKNQKQEVAEVNAAPADVDVANVVPKDMVEPWRLPLSRAYIDDRRPGDILGRVTAYREDKASVNNSIAKTGIALKQDTLIHGNKNPGKAHKIVSVSVIMNEEKNNSKKKRSQYARPDKQIPSFFMRKDTKAEELIQNRRRETRQANASLVMITEARVALGAVPVLVATLAQELPRPIKIVEKSIARHRKKEVRKILLREKNIRKNEHVIKKENYEQKKSIASRELGVESKSIKRVRRFQAIETAIIGLLSRKDKPLRKEKKITIHKEPIIVIPTQTVNEFHSWEKKKKDIERTAIAHLETRGIVRQSEKILWTAVAVLATEFNRFKRKKETHAVRKETQFVEKRKKLQEAIVGFSLTWVIVLLLELDMKKVQKEKNKQETGVAHEKTPWLLLSIIWHLAMIREQGMVRSTAASQQKLTKKQSAKKKKKKLSRLRMRSLPPQGVIYTRFVV